MGRKIYMIFLKIINKKKYSTKAMGGSPSELSEELYLHHSSFSNPSVASPTSKFILQSFFRFSYVTSSSLNSPGEPPMLLHISYLLCPHVCHFILVMATILVHHSSVCCISHIFSTSYSWPFSLSSFLWLPF